MAHPLVLVSFSLFFSETSRALRTWINVLTQWISLLGLQLYGFAVSDCHDAIALRWSFVSGSKENNFVFSERSDDAAIGKYTLIYWGWGNRVITTSWKSLIFLAHLEETSQNLALADKSKRFSNSDGPVLVEILCIIRSRIIEAWIFMGFHHVRSRMATQPFAFKFQKGSHVGVPTK